MTEMQDEPKVKDPLIELLAIKLYEHDFGQWPPKPGVADSWTALAEHERNDYRAKARGEAPLESF